MQTSNAPDDTSWWDDLVGALSQKPVPPPPAPQPPPVDQSAWEKSVEQAKISDSLGTVHDLGLRIFGETQSFSDRPDSNEPIDLAREKMAWTIMNGYKKWGADRQKWASTASPIEPSEQALQDPPTRRLSILHESCAGGLSWLERFNEWCGLLKPAAHC